MENNISFFDLEATGLDAETAFVIMYGMMDERGTFRSATLKKVSLENELIECCIKDLAPLKRVVTWFGTYDLRMITSKALKYDINPTPLLKVNYIDLWAYAKEHLLLRRYNLRNVAKYFGIQIRSETTGRDIPQLCFRAIEGDHQAFQQIKNHLKDDLTTVRAVWQKMKPIVGR